MKINKKELLGALEKVKPGLSQKELIEQATSFAFMGEKVVTYNDEISISHPIKGLDIKGAIKAQSLYEFLNRVKEEEIDLECEENQIVIKSKRAKAGLKLEQEIQLPVSEIGEFGEWEKLPENFKEAMKFCYPCCTHDMSYPVLTCVYVSEDTVQASDSYQIVNYKLKEEMPCKDFLIPANSVRELIKYDIEEIAEGLGWMHFKIKGGTVFSSRVIEAEFPDTKPHLKIEGEEFVFPKKIDEILSKALVFSKDSNSEDFPVVTVEIKNNYVKISSDNDYGWFEEKSKIEYAGNPIKFSIGIEFLINLFSKLQNCIIGTNTIKFGGEDWVHIVAMINEGGKE
jgi:DNA polymerase III sliding clamp (beta) subunit (PCNA family)